MFAFLFSCNMHVINNFSDTLCCFWFPFLVLTSSRNSLYRRVLFLLYLLKILPSSLSSYVTFLLPHWFFTTTAFYRVYYISLLLYTSSSFSLHPAFSSCSLLPPVVLSTIQSPAPVSYTTILRCYGNTDTRFVRDNGINNLVCSPVWFICSNPA